MNPALALLHGLITDTGKPWGSIATDWQRADAEAVLEPVDNAPRLHWCGRPKGGSKSTDLAGISLAWVLEQAQPMDEGFAVAADEEQANRLLDKARGFVARTPALRGRVDVEAKRIVNRSTGARVQALAADVSGSEGLLTPFVVVDELPNWASTASARGMWTSVVSAVPKVKGMRLVVIGHAGDPAHWSHKVLLQARRSSRWRVNEVPGPLPWMNADDLAEQRALLTESQYARRFLNQWVAAEDRLATPDQLRDCVTLAGPLDAEKGRKYVVTLDVGLVNDSTVVMVCHAEPRPDAAPGSRAQTVVLDRVLRWRGSKNAPVSLDDVEAALLQVWERYNHPVVVADPWQSIGLLQRLRAHRVKVEEFSFTASSVGRLGQTLFLHIRDRALALPDDDELLDELANIRLKETPAGLRLDHDANRHDDQGVALALGCEWLATHQPKRVDPRAAGEAMKINALDLHAPDFARREMFGSGGFKPW